LREKREQRGFENRMLRRIFGPKRDKVTWEWRKLHNEKLKDLYSSSNIICFLYVVWKFLGCNGVSRVRDYIII
jgi:hypothetical protein